MYDSFHSLFYIHLFPLCSNKQYIAKATEEESERLFTELIHSIKSSQSEMKVLIRAQERAELDRIEELMEQVEEEITELKWSDAEMEQNDIHLLQVA